MPDFKYTAIDKRGKKVEGTYTANNKNQVLTMIKDNKYIPVKIKEIKQSTEINIAQYLGKVKTKDISIFCRQFYTMLNAGVSILNCLEILGAQTGNKKLKNVINEIYDDVQKGVSLYEAMKKHNNIFPELLINMVEAGEASGNLDTIMERMAVHFEKENKINSKVQAAMIYPIVLAVVSVIVVFFMITFILPTFVGMFEGSGVELPLPTRILMSISDFLKSFWYIIFAGLIAGGYSLSKFANSEKGKFIIDNFKFRVPIVNTTTKMIVTSRFTRTLSTLLASGISLLESLKIVSNVVGNVVVKKGIKKASEDVRKGISLSEPIRSIGIFPPMVESMVRIGEESGSLDEILEKTADFYDDEVEATIQKMTTALEPLMIVVMAVVMGAIIIAMVMPMFKMFDTMNF